MGPREETKMDSILLETTRQWMQSYRTLRNAPDVYTMRLLCSCYNWATNPAALYTDAEHALLRHVAAWCEVRLNRIGAGWITTDSGKKRPYSD